MLTEEYGRERCETIAEYIIRTKDTVRGAAAEFGVSKSTVHKDITERLGKISPSLSAAVKSVLEQNKAERHLRGGEATKQKYRRMKKKLSGFYSPSKMPAGIPAFLLRSLTLPVNAPLLFRIL